MGKLVRRHTTLTRLALVAAALAVAACGDNLAGPALDGPPAPTPDAAQPQPTITSVAIDPPAPALAAGTTLQLTATATLSDGSTTNVTTTATWLSDEDAVATVAGGLVTGHRRGDASITASIEGRSTSVNLDVTSAALLSIAITPTAPSVALGTDPQFTATGTFSDTTTQNLTTQVAWSSSDEAVATISNLAGSQGRADTVGTGATTITAALGAISGTTPMTVTDATLVSIAVTPDAANIPLGVDPQFTAIGTYSDTSTTDLTTQVTWGSSDPAVATIAASGIATTLAPGPTTISATFGAISGSTVMTVTDATLLSIAVTPVDPSAPLGVDPPFLAIGTYSDTSTLDITDQVLWASSDPSIAAVSNAPGSEGIATTLAIGTTTISATSGAIAGSSDLQVTAAELQSITIAPVDPTVPLGIDPAFTATGHFTDGSTPDLTTAVLWASSIPAVATISNAAGSEGVATTLATGPTTISATSGAIAGTTILTVAPPALVSIDVTPTNPSVAVGADQPFTATGTFTDGSTGNVTALVGWSSSDEVVATISSAPGSDGVATALAIGSTTITATSGAIADTAIMTTFLAPVGPWVAVGGGFTGTPCWNGLGFVIDGTSVLACTTAGGVLRGTVVAPTMPDSAITWAPANTLVDNLAGLAIAANHPASATQGMYFAQPTAGLDNFFRTGDGGTTWAPSAVLDSAGAPRAIYAGKFQPGLPGGGIALASWDPGPGGAGQAQFLHGNNPPFTIRDVSTATGAVRAIASNAANNLYVAVYGQTPSGAPATGGVYRSTSGMATMWTAQDTGIAAADKPRVFSVTMDAVTPTTLYAAIQGGARIYKTTDGGAGWTASATGISTGARVNAIAIASTGTLYAATSLGLYQSTDAGATWTLAGFQGRVVRTVAIDPLAPALVLVGVEDATGVYRPM